MYSTEQEARCFLGKPDATDEQDDLKTPTTNADELGGIAAEFGSKIVPGLLSPAAIQSFLIRRKRWPRKSLYDVQSWVQAMAEQKASKIKISQNQ